MRFEDVIRRFGVDLYRYAFWLARDRQQAEDIVQEALLRGWRAYPRLREPAAVKSWLFSIVRNEYLRAMETNSRQPESLEGLDPADEREPDPGLEMREALMALPASYAEPLALQVLGGFSCAEIAAMLGTTEGAAMTRLHARAPGAEAPRCAGERKGTQRRAVMNCLDYRRSLAAGEPETADMKAHRLQCSACAAQSREHAEFERALRAGLAVEVPSGFEERLKNAIVFSRRRFLAAAGVAAAAAGIGSYAWLSRDEPLAFACVEFVMKEEVKSVMMGPMPRAEAEAALAGTLPLERIERIGQVKHIGPCPFNGAMAYHVVLSVPQGKVTLLVMPAGSAGAGQTAEHEGLYAKVVSLRKGSLGVIGSDRTVVNSVVGALRT